MRYAGKIGFGYSEEVEPGVWENVIVARQYKGDMIWTKRQVDQGDDIIETVRVNNALSVLIDSYMDEHLYDVKYIEWRGKLWTVSSIEILHPRVTMYIGGRYNGPTPEVA